MVNPETCAKEKAQLKQARADLLKISEVAVFNSIGSG